MLARPCLSFTVKATKRGSFLCADSGKTASRLWKFCNCLWLSTKFHMQILGPDYRYLIIYLIYAAAHGDAARRDSLTPRQSRPRTGRRMGQNRTGWDRDRTGTWETLIMPPLSLSPVVVPGNGNGTGTSLIWAHAGHCPDMAQCLPWHMAHGATWHLAVPLASLPASHVADLQHNNSMRVRAQEDTC